MTSTSPQGPGWADDVLTQLREPTPVAVGSAGDTRAAATPAPAAAYRAPAALTALAERPRAVHRHLSARPARTRGQRSWDMLRALAAPPDRAARMDRAMDTLRTPFATGRRVAVIGAHGGAGATTLALCLTTIAHAHRGDPVALVDAAVTHGGLLTRLPVAPTMSVEAAARTMNDAARGVQSPVRRGDGPVLFSPAAAQATRHVLDGIQRHCAVTFIDAGTDAVAHTSSAHAIVVVAENTVRGVAAAQASRNELAAAGRTADRVVVVLTCRVADSGVDEAWTRGELSAEGAALHHIPRDRHLAGAAQVHLDLLAPDTYLALTETAAAIMATSAGMP
ncbi:N/A [soil metagenome]